MMNATTKDRRAMVMAIINITPDSFFTESRNTTEKEIALRVETALEEGADILDIGGYSTRPDAQDISIEMEIERLEMAFGVVRKLDDKILVSVDTFRSPVVERLYDGWGEFWVNDISAGRLDLEMIPLVGRLKLPYIAMHSRGTPKTMQQMTQYENITEDIMQFFKDKVTECQQAGIEELILDPGFGFAKTMEQNYKLLANMNLLCEIGFPMLVGISRKAMIWKLLGATPSEALNGTTALNWEALRQGASILRVHDVREAVEVSRIFHIFEQANLKEL